MSKPVPSVPSLDYDRKQAKALLKAAKLDQPEALERFRLHHPAGLSAQPRLSDAQLVIAREYGFPTVLEPALRRHGSRTATNAEAPATNL